MNGGFAHNLVSSDGVDLCPFSPNLPGPFDLNGNGVTCTDDPLPNGGPSDDVLFFQTSLFFLDNWKDPAHAIRRHTTDDITDGLTHTLMIVENVKVGYNPTDPVATWASSDPLLNSFFISGAVCRQGSCAPGNVDYRLANSGATAINGSLDKPEGTAPWPSSLHAGGVNAVFADGHVKFISQQIDGAVYAALVTPQGSRIVGPLVEHPLNDADY